MNKLAHWVLFAGFFLGMVGTMAAESRKSLARPRADSVRTYSFLVGGHLYDSRSPHAVLLNPALYANLNRINQDDSRFFLGCGDVMGSSGNTISMGFFDDFFHHQLEKAFYNAPGNHDLIDQAAYEAKMGMLHRSFVWSRDRFILLNSESIAKDTADQQLAYFLNLLEPTPEWDTIQNIFIFSHRLLWAYHRPEFSEAVSRSNVSTSLDFETAFMAQFQEKLEQVAEGKQVFWFTGDVGREDSYPLFYETDPERLNFHYLATGLGIPNEEALIKVSVNAAGQVKLLPFPLAGQSMEPIEAYGRSALSTRFEGAEPVLDGSFTGKLMLYFSNRYFQRGLLAGVTGFATIILLLVALKNRWFNREK